MNPSPTPGQRIQRWLADHWVAMAGTALVCLGLWLTSPRRSNPSLPGASGPPLSKKARQQAVQAQAARLDSIRRESQQLPRLVRTRDSALAEARRQNARANLFLQRLHEAASTPSTSAPQHLARDLANYRPGSYAFDSTTVIR